MTRTESPPYDAYGAADLAELGEPGAPVTGQMESLLLVLTGRSDGVCGLSGDGPDNLRDRITQR